MSSEKIKVEILEKDRIAVVKLNNPKKYNAVSWQMFQDIHNAFNSIATSGKDIRAIVFAGEGKHFTSGLDRESAMELG